MPDVIEHFDGTPVRPRPPGMLRRVRAAWPFDVLDVLALVGLVLLAYGCSLIHPALPWIVTGVLVLVYSFVAALPPRTGGV